jgi:hypothetical protein
MRIFPISIAAAVMVAAMQMAMAQNASSAAAGKPAAGEEKSMHVLDDVNTGDRWVLTRDTAHPGGPGRLLRLDRPVRIDRQDRQECVDGSEPVANRAVVKPVMVIRGGDRVVVEEKTAAIEARLQGVALAPAGVGELVNVRLTAGGWLVRGMVEESGRVRLVGEAKR